MSSTVPTERAPERIARRMARAGLCSRRDAERWIAEGRVILNGQKLDSPAVVVSDTDVILVDGKPLPKPAPTRLWRYHKPYGLVTSARDEKGRDTVFDHLPKNLPRVVSVGRLDLTSEGLLLLTNDGDLARSLELPSSGWERVYRARAHGRQVVGAFDRLREGVTIDGVQYGPVHVRVERAEASNMWLEVTIFEGKNREIRRVLEDVGLVVNRLIRTKYGPYELGDLTAGAVAEVTTDRMAVREPSPMW